MPSLILFVAKLAPMTVAAAALFTLTWLVLGRISTGFTLFGDVIAPYNWVAQPVSGLGLGKTGPAMNTVFVLTGVLMAIGVLGVIANLPSLSIPKRAVIGGFFLLSSFGISMCGVFTLEQFKLHFLGFLLATVMPIFGFLALGWWLMPNPAYAGLSRLLIAAAPVTLALLVLQIWSFDPENSGRGLGFGGLTQRILITEVLGVFAILGWSFRSASLL